MAAESLIELRMWLAWWFYPYVRCLLFFCQLSGGFPDEEKLARVVRRAIKVKRL